MQELGLKLFIHFSRDGGEKVAAGPVPLARLSAGPGAWGSSRESSGLPLLSYSRLV